MYYTSFSVRQLKTKGRPWQARLNYKDANGKWQQTAKTLREAKGKKDAERMAQALMDELNKQAEELPYATSDKTVSEAVVSYLDYQLANGEIEQSSYYAQMKRFKNWIEPKIGDYDFATLDKIVITKWLTDLHQAGLKSGTIRTIYSVLSKVYSYHYFMENIPNNPFDHIKPPKKSEPAITHLTPEQYDSVWTSLNDDYDEYDWFWIAVNLSLYTGMRRAEVCGLRWNCVDFNRRAIAITTSIGIYDGGTYTKLPKTATSNRVIPMTTQVEMLLEMRYKAVEEEYGTVEGSWYVCGKKDKYTSPKTFSWTFRQFACRNNLVDVFGNTINIRALRHNLATTGVRSGMDIKSLANMLGHSDAAMTLNVYADDDADAMRLAVDKLSEQFDNESAY